MLCACSAPEEKSLHYQHGTVDVTAHAPVTNGDLEVSPSMGMPLTVAHVKPLAELVRLRVRDGVSSQAKRR